MNVQIDRINLGLPLDLRALMSGSFSIAAQGNCPPQWPKSILENTSSGFMANQTQHYIWIENISCDPCCK